MPELVTSNDAHYAYDIVKAICTEVGPGLPGSSQSLYYSVLRQVAEFSSTIFTRIFPISLRRQ
jgi:hypothetical protein